MSSESEEEQQENKIDQILKEVLAFKKQTSRDLTENSSLIKQLIAGFDNLKKDIKILKKESENQKVKLREQYLKINHLEKQLLETSVSIQNVPHNKDEVLTDLVYKIAQKLDVKITSSSVSNIFRKNQKKNGLPGEVIVKFNSKFVHDAMINQAKKKRLNLLDIGFQGDKTVLYINQVLSSVDKELFYEARKFQKSFGWKFVWEKFGNVFVRKQEGSQAIRVSSIDQLHELSK